MPWRSVLHQTKIAKFADGFTTIFSLVLSYYIWQFLRVTFPVLPLGFDFALSPKHFIIIFITVLGCYIGFITQNAYSYQRFTSFTTELKIVLKTIVIIGLSIPASIFLLRVPYIPRSLIVIFLFINFITFAIEKLLLFHIAGAIRQRGSNRKRIIVVGKGVRTKKFIETVKKHSGWGLDIAGLITNNKGEVGRRLYGRKIIGTIEDMEKVLHSYLIDEVIITLSTTKFELIQSIINQCEREGVRVHIISDFFGQIVKHIRADIIYDLPIITLSMIHEKFGQLFIKRLMDIVVSLIFLILLSPLFLIISILIKATSRGPILYKWKVVGYNKKPFTSWKFRTMIVGAEEMKESLMHLNEMEGPVFKIKKDPRVTKIGRFLRKHSLDELPQLLSVIKGDMSLVGPRPVFAHELQRYDSWHRRKLSTKPGITCLWQVNGRNEIGNFDQWVKMDLHYIDNWSIWLDFKILLKTIMVVLSGKGAS